MFFKKNLKNPGLLFMKHRYSRSFYSYISLTINNIFESKQKREWQQKLYQENSNKIDDKVGYLLTDDSFFKNSQLIMKVYSDTNSIISKNIENQGGSKSFLTNILCNCSSKQEVLYSAHLEFESKKLVFDSIEIFFKSYESGR